ncbi:MAG: helix-turn-helix domain-containing protein [Micavibrio sp.]
MTSSSPSAVAVYMPDLIARKVLTDLGQCYGVPVSFVEKEEDGLVLPLPQRAGDILQILRQAAQAQAGAVGIQSFAGYEFDAQQSALISKDSEEEILLTEKEVAILKTLLNEAGKYVSRRDLLTGVWGYVEGVETHTLETHIYRLRQKIEKDPSAPAILLTAEQGYKIVVGD